MKRILVLIVLLLGILGGTILFRDSLISRILPVIASHRGISLETNGLHLDLSPLILDVRSLEMRWKTGHVHMEGVKIHLSPFSLIPKEVCLNKCKVQMKLGTGEGGWLSLPPFTLRRLDLKSLDLTVESPWGLGRITGGRVLLGSKRFSLTGELAAKAGRSAFQGHFSFSGEREDLSRGQPQGKGIITGQLSWGEKRVKGTLNMPHLTISPSMEMMAPGLSLTIPSLLSFKGDLHLTRGYSVLTGDGQIPSLKALHGFFPRVPQGVGGALSFSGKVTNGKTLRYTLSVSGKGLRLKKIGGIRDMEASLKGDLEGRGGEGTFHLRDLYLKRVVFPKMEEKGWKGTGDVSWKEWGEGGIRGELSLKREKRSVRLRFSSPTLALEGAKGKGEIEGITLVDIQPFMASFYPSVGKVKLKGSVKVQGDISFQSGEWVTSIWWFGKDVSFSGPGGNGGEGLMVRGDLTASRGLAQGPWQISILFSKGEALVSPWYFDFSQTPWSFTFTLARRKKRVCIVQAHHRGMVQAAFKGLFCSQQRGEGVLSLYGDAGPLYAQLVAEPFEMEDPYLGEIHLKGRIGARLSLEKRGKWMVSGPITWKGEVEGKGFSFQGGFTFPFIYRPQGKGEGSLKISSFALGPIKIENWGILLKGFPYRMRGERGIDFPLWKGHVSSGPFTFLYKDLHQLQVEVDGLTIQGVQPSWMPLPAKVEGSFNKLRGSPQEIRLRGEIRATLAKGEVRISRVWISHPFTSLMRIGGDVTFSHLDLEELTGITPFGKMTGYIRGFIKNLVISHGQPEAFQLRIESQKVKGTRKRISLRAINSISILGGGGAVSLFLPFFKEFGYKYLGLSCSLRNDMFTLHGLKKEGNVEYIVKRGGLTGVSVINRNPDNGISFEDMMERLKRMGRKKNDKG